MLFAAFAHRKLVLLSQLNTAQTCQMQSSDRLMALAMDKNNLQQQISVYQQLEAEEKAALYEDLAQDDGTYRNSIQAYIDQVSAETKALVEDMQREINDIALKESIEQNYGKHLDSLVQKLQGEYEAVEEAEGKGAEANVPKYLA